jgi:uncharacterized protein (TIGR00369 family)
MSGSDAHGHDGWGTPRSKTVSWYDPAALGAAAAKLPGRQFLQAIAEGRLPEPPMAILVGARLVSVGDGEVRFLWTPDESVYNALGTVHGGLLCTLLDFAAGTAVHSPLPAGVGLSSIEIKVSYLRRLRADAGVIEIHGHVLRAGGRVAFAEAHAHDASGELVAHASSSIALLTPGRAKPADD